MIAVANIFVSLSATNEKYVCASYYVIRTWQCGKIYMWMVYFYDGNVEMCQMIMQ